jgi:hypothetical protein
MIQSIGKEEDRIFHMSFDSSHLSFADSSLKRNELVLSDFAPAGRDVYSPMSRYLARAP